MERIVEGGQRTTVIRDVRRDTVMLHPRTVTHYGSSWIIFPTASGIGIASGLMAATNLSDRRGNGSGREI
eukprot:6460665-Amphidinium_carterae.1